MISGEKAKIRVVIDDPVVEVPAEIVEKLIHDSEKGIHLKHTAYMDNFTWSYSVQVPIHWERA